jgi:HTH-type transcriptional regulator, transcriptional repressor of NAD biosynthesis genes
VKNKRVGGVVIGRFMPPHRGHCYLIDFAKSFAADLTVFVCTLKEEPISGELRYRWMRELFPTVRVIHITEEIPEASRASDGAQDIWAESILRHLDSPPEFVFASEEYGVDLASSLGAKFVPVDPQRSLFPISAGMIRSDPLAHWEYIPAIVRPYFVRKISVVANGPELVRNLAAQFDTIYATNYLAYRQRLAFAEPTITSPGDMLAAQISNICALLGQANRVLFLETDLLRSILSTNNEEVLAKLDDGAYDEVLETSRPDLVLVLSPLDARYRAELERRGWLFRELDPNAPNRETEAASIVRDVLKQPRE